MGVSKIESKYTDIRCDMIDYMISRLEHYNGTFNPLYLYEYNIFRAKFNYYFNGNVYFTFDTESKKAKYLYVTYNRGKEKVSYALLLGKRGCD